MKEIVGIDRVILDEDANDLGDVSDLVGLTMSILPRELFHIQLEDLGYFVGEGRRGVINEYEEEGIIFPVYRLENGERTDKRVAEICTFLDRVED